MFTSESVIQSVSPCLQTGFRGLSLCLKVAQEQPFYSFLP